jgi:hypothetical protein
MSLHHKNLYTRSVAATMCLLLSLAALPCKVASAEGVSGFRDKTSSCRALNESISRALCFEKLSMELLVIVERGDQMPVAGSNEANAVTRWGGFIRNAKQTISDDLKDPETVKFRKLVISDGQVPKLCGELNAKNSYGAYIGFQKFIVTEKGEVKVIQGHSIDMEVFDRSWLYYCTENAVKID